MKKTNRSRTVEVVWWLTRQEEQLRSIRSPIEEPEMIRLRKHGAIDAW